jgi:hypothetical protein
MELWTNRSVEQRLQTQFRKYVGALISLWLSKGISFLQDNAAPHKATITHQKFADLHFEKAKDLSAPLVAK